MPRKIFAALLLFVLTCPAARGEIVVLKTGGQVEGELLNASRKSDEAVELRTPQGVKLSFGPQQVQRVIIKTDAEKQYELLAPKAADTVAAQWDLAEWCRQAGLTELRHRHLEAILRLEPNHEDARGALGYQKFDGQWMKPEDWMRGRGYVRYQGSWRLKQEVEIDVRARQAELADKQWRQKIKMWKEQLGNSKRSADAWTNLQAIRDPHAAPALVDIFKDPQESRELRIACLENLLKMPGGDYVGGVLVRLALHDPDENIRDRCLELLHDRRSGEALVVFVKLLKDKNNKMVNLAASCLERLDDPEATLPLIEALNTTHTYWIQQGGGPGGIGASFGKNDPGSAAGPLGGMAMGGKPKPVKQDHQNTAVRNALSRLHPGVNHGFDEDKWRRWYADTFTTTKVNLRRD